MTVYLFVFEFIGTPELVLIALVALIIFGPRKLPSIGRTIGKYTTEFKRASNEFRRSWEYEVEMAEREGKTVRESDSLNGSDGTSNDFPSVENTIGRASPRRQAKDEESFAALNESNSIALPEIRAINQGDFATNTTAQSEPAVETNDSAAARSKREWL